MITTSSNGALSFSLPVFLSAGLGTRLLVDVVETFKVA